MGKLKDTNSSSIYRIGGGIDVGADELYACVLISYKSGDYKVYKRRKFNNTPSGCSELVLWIQRCYGTLLKVKSIDGETPPAFRVLFEASGSYHEEALYQCYEAGIPVSLMLPRVVKHYKHTTSVNTKTDRSDAEVIARFCAERMPDEWNPASPKLMELREVLRLREQVVKRKTQDTNRLHAYKRKRVENEVVLNTYLNSIKEADAKAAELESAAINICKEDEELYAKLKVIVNSTPGVGWLTMLTVFVETDGFSSIKNMKQLASYAGLDVVENQSGQKSGKRHISKHGNKHVRRALYMAAIAIIRTRKGAIYELGYRVRKRNPEIKQKGTVAVMRKLLIVVCSLYKSGEAFDSERNTLSGTEDDISNSTESTESKATEAIQKDSPEGCSRLYEVDNIEVSPNVTKIMGKNKEMACIETQ